MHRNAPTWITVLCLGLGWGGAAVAQDVNLICESRGDNYQYCPVNTRGGVWLEQQLSKSDCVLGRTWGYDKRGVWVDNGCRGRFKIGDGGWGGPSHGDQIVRCESQQGRYEYCSADTREGVDLQRQLSDADCRYGDSWGYDRGGIWVDNGCRAEFRLGGGRPGGGYPGGGHGGSPKILRCESHDDRYEYCPADTRGGVELERRLSKSDCRHGESWGYDRRGVWVNRGCRAEFRLGDDGYPDGGHGDSETILRCESHDDRYQYCPARTRGGVELERRLSKSDCRYGESWGYDRHGIWVNRGCRADFRLGGR